MADVRHEVLLPDLGLGRRRVQASVWLVPLGSELAAGDRLLEVVADGVTIDLPAPVSGRLAEQRVAEEDMLHVGQVLAVMEQRAERIPRPG